MRRALPFLFVLVPTALSLLACGGPELYAGMPEHVKTRHVALEGAHNFRDLGGYPSEDGRAVRWGLFYRSDALGDLTDADVATVAGLGLKLVCDFRTPEEKAEAPDRLPSDPAPEVLELEIGVEGAKLAELQERILSGDLAGVDLGQMLVEGNRAFVTDFVDRYARLLERVQHAEALPTLVHCTGGKDRAGMASALILRTLGVPEEVVFEDFLLTNHYTGKRIERSLLFIRFASLFRTDPDEVRPIMGVERAYLQAGFDEIRKRHGSFDAFRRDALGVSDEDLVAFRNLALE
ncbi:MAG: protein-tyrosine-phosphatase [Deltaproteobacteria bacterium]|jgi:protein-tyrosine phosphatase|nr:protein-tyrosine-phosphatase [Deltaproteobacteria bacterium]